MLTRVVIGHRTERFDCLHPNSSSPLHPAMHINNLPSLVFGLIFSRLSLHDQLQAGRVCWLWKEYQQDITTKVRSLTLLVGVETYDRINPNSSMYHRTLPLDLIAQSPFTLHHCSELLNDQGDGPLFAIQPKFGLLNFPYLNSSTVNQLVESLPNVHTLNISINGIHCYVIDEVIRLLNQWKHQLVTLKLWCDFSDGNPSVDEYFRLWKVYKNIPQPIVLTLAKLLESLNSQSSLDHLTLDFKHNFYSNFYFSKSHIPDYNFSILSRLLEFNFRSLDNFTKLPIYKWLKQCDLNGTQLQQIGLDFEYEFDEYVYLALPLASKMIVLPQVEYVDDDVEDIVRAKEEIRRYLKACPSLTSLRFEVFDDFVELINLLGPFKQLIHLELDLNYYNHEFFNNFDRTPSHQIVQLSSVKLLTLKCKKHCNLNSRNLGWAFPNVQILQVEHNCFQQLDNRYRCYDFSEYKSKWTKKFLDQLVSGVRDWLATFKQMPKLRRIYLNDMEKGYKEKYDLVKFNFTL